jgi:glycosyltransferase involved in cell wall biosynthesis
MKKYPSISIAIPVLNEEKNIDRCLSSIYRQKYKGGLEVFIVDNDSNDKTLEIASHYPVRIVKTHEKDLLVKKMIALKKATGKYFLFLDADIDLVGAKWFEKMVKPLEEDKNIVGSFTGYVSYSSDKPLNRYITLDFLQRDPIFSWITPSLSSVVTEKRRGYDVCRYQKNKMLPAGLVIYRRAEIAKTEIGSRKRFNELDNIVILFNLGKNQYAYVPDAGLHHPFISTFRTLIHKRRRNIFTMYFDQPDQRMWMWIDWKSPIDLLKIVIWIVYSNSIILPFLVGVYKSVNHKTWVGLYEPFFNLIDTDIIFFSFIQKAAYRLINKTK